MAGTLGFLLPGVEAEISMALGQALGQIPGQTFRNKPVVNKKPAIYQLVMREPKPSNAVVVDFIFPLSPEGLRERFVALSNVYDVNGSFKRGAAVDRIVDQFGNTPPIFTLVGTTGWQKHSTDNYQFTGLEASTELGSFLTLYAISNSEQVEKGLPDMYRMEFYDFFRDRYWQVVPVGEQEFTQRRNRPLLVDYRLTLAATVKLDKPEVPQPDTLSSNLGRALSEAASDLGNFISNMFTDYTDVTLSTN